QLGGARGPGRRRRQRQQRLRLAADVQLPIHRHLRASGFAIYGAALRHPRRHRILRHVDGRAARRRRGGHADAPGHHQTRGDRGRARENGRRSRHTRPRRAVRVRTARRAERTLRQRCGEVRPAIALALLLFAAAPARAQGGLFDATGDAPAVSLRPFFQFSNQWFAADQTFKAVFEDTSAQFWGGGGQVTLWDGRIYGESAVRRLVKSDQTLVGQRVFVGDDGAVFRLGIPVRVKIEPLEFTGGYRFNAHPRLIPYVGAGIGRYHYSEESDFATDAEKLDVTKNG